MGHLEHKQKAPASVGCAVITVSDTRTPESDSSGALMQELLKRGGHRVTGYRIVKDSPVSIEETLLTYLNDKSIDAILLTGGTGISRHDSTYEVVKTLLEKEIDGFGELFRFLSYQSIGAPAMLSRSTAGVCQGKIVISLPGSEEAVRLAMTALVLPELPHMIYLIR